MTLAPHAIALTRLKRIEATVVFGAERIMERNRKVLAARLWAAVNEQFQPVVEPENQCLVSGQ